jgi:hypothetical protein
MKFKAKIATTNTDRSGSRFTLEALKDPNIAIDYFLNPIVLFDFDINNPPIGKCDKIFIENNELYAILDVNKKFEEIPIKGAIGYKPINISYSSKKTNNDKPLIINEFEFKPLIINEFELLVISLVKDNADESIGIIEPIDNE